MHKYFLLFFILTNIAFTKEKIEILAGNLDINSTNIEASNSVSIFFKDSYIRADKAFYDRKNKILELFGNINILKSSILYGAGEYAKIYIDQNGENIISPVFLYEKRSSLWISSKEVCEKNGLLSLKNSISSSCNPQNPDWSIKFTKGSYSSKSKWMELFNPVLYIKNIPIFYLPYFALPLDDTRRSGLLAPNLESSSDEGLGVELPIYIAEYDNWDLIFSPEIRTKRGGGIFSTFRFVDSLHSKGEIQSGIFWEKASYQKKFKIGNNTHKGIEVFYENNKVLENKLKPIKDDGLFIDVKLMNDINYLNIKMENKEKVEISRIVNSKINYFMKKDKNLLGIYSVYNLDTDKDKDTNTLQKLPQINYHKNTQSIFFNNILYSLDAKFTNYYRAKGNGATEEELKIPINYSISLFNKYIKLRFKETPYVSKISFNKTSGGKYKNGYYANTNHFIEMSTYLIRPYEKFNHSFNLSFDHTWEGLKKSSGYYEENMKELQSLKCKEGDPCEFTNIDFVKENSNIIFKQYFNSKKGIEILNHKLKQKITYDKEENKGNKFSELISDLYININSDTKLSNYISYSNILKKVNKTINTIQYKLNNVKLHLLDTYEVRGEKNTNYFIANLEYDYDKKNKYFASMEYDFINKKYQKWSFGWSKNKDCWKYDIDYSRSLRIGSKIVDSKVFLRVSLIPFGRLKYEYKWSESKDNR